MSRERLEKSVMLRAPLERVWRAISDAGQFGLWFGVRFDADFAPGATLVGRVTPTTVDEAVAKAQKPYEGAPFTILIDRIEPMKAFAFRWHPFALDPAVDYDQEPMTLVTFELFETDGGVLLVISESGFEQIDPGRRDTAYAANEAGWTAQTKLIAKYLAVG